MSSTLSVRSPVGDRAERSRRQLGASGSLPNLPPPATAEDHLREYATTGGYAVPEFTYVIQGVPGTPIKVGRAKDPIRRLATFQTGHWQEHYLLYVIPGGAEMERSLHHCLRADHIRGEWFKCDHDFLWWVHDFAEYALWLYTTGQVIEPPVTPLPPKRAKRPHLSKRQRH